VARDGGPFGGRPSAMSFRFERSQKQWGWTTIVTLQDAERPVVRSGAGPRALDNPFLIHRIEYDDDGLPPRFYNRRGERVRGPGASDRKLVSVPDSSSSDMPDWEAVARRMAKGPVPATSSDWTDGLIATPEKRAKRKDDLERKFGKAQGRVGGKDRYVASNGDVTVEVLVDPDQDVPVEINTTRRGELVAHSLAVHERHSSGALVRRLLRAEQVSGDAAGTRAVTEIEVTNVSLTRGGAQ